MKKEFVLFFVVFILQTVNAGCAQYMPGAANPDGDCIAENCKEAAGSILDPDKYDNGFCLKSYFSDCECSSKKAMDFIGCSTDIIYRVGENGKIISISKTLNMQKNSKLCSTRCKNNNLGIDCNSATTPTTCEDSYVTLSEGNINRYYNCKWVDQKCIFMKTYDETIDGVNARITEYLKPCNLSISSNNEEDDDEEDKNIGDKTKTCAEQKGKICASTVTCVGSTIVAKDTDKCCLGNCVSKTQRCADSGKVLCDGESKCVGTLDAEGCCEGHCEVIAPVYQPCPGETISDCNYENKIINKNEGGCYQCVKKYDEKTYGKNCWQLTELESCPGEGCISTKTEKNGAIISSEGFLDLSGNCLEKTCENVYGANFEECGDKCCADTDNNKEITENCNAENNFAICCDENENTETVTKTQPKQGLTQKKIIYPYCSASKCPEGLETATGYFLDYYGKQKAKSEIKVCCKSGETAVSVNFGTNLVVPACAIWDPNAKNCKEEKYITGSDKKKVTTIVDGKEMNVCCPDNTEWKTYNYFGFQGCVPTSCDTGEMICKGKGDSSKDATVCCPYGSTCFWDPSGNPLCVDLNTKKEITSSGKKTKRVATGHYTAKINEALVDISSGLIEGQEYSIDKENNQITVVGTHASFYVLRDPNNLHLNGTAYRIENLGANNLEYPFTLTINYQDSEIDEDNFRLYRFSDEDTKKLCGIIDMKTGKEISGTEDNVQLIDEGLESYKELIDSNSEENNIRIRSNQCLDGETGYVANGKYYCQDGSSKTSVLIPNPTYLNKGISHNKDTTVSYYDLVTSTAISQGKDSQWYVNYLSGSNTDSYKLTTLIDGSSLKVHPYRAYLQKQTETEEKILWYDYSIEGNELEPEFSKVTLSNCGDVAYGNVMYETISAEGEPYTTLIFIGNNETWELDSQIVEVETEEKPKEENKETIEENSTKCFVATAVYGGENAPEVETLREVRDNVLKKSDLGNAFVHFYYSGVGRETADFVKTESPILIPFIKEKLDRVVEVYNLF